MLDMLMQGRSRTNDWHYSHVGELLFNYFMVVCHLDPCQHIRLWHAADNRLVAYAVLGEDPAFDCQVFPEYEGFGIEADALAWTESRVVHLRKQDEALWSGNMVSGARQDDLKRIQFLVENGFCYVGRFAEVNMIRSLHEPIPVLPIPDGYRVSSMLDVNDISDRAAAHREVWTPWTVANVTEDDYLRFMQFPGYHPALDVVTLTPAGVIAAYVNGWIDPLNRIGDFGPVGARSEYRRQGLTRLALLEGLRRMQAYGMDRVCISTGITNTPAQNLYKSVGFRVVNRYLDFMQSTDS